MSSLSASDGACGVRLVGGSPLAAAPRYAPEHGVHGAVVLRRPEERRPGLCAGVPHSDRNSAYDSRGEAASAEETSGLERGQKVLRLRRGAVSLLAPRLGFPIWIRALGPSGYGPAGFRMWV